MREYFDIKRDIEIARNGGFWCLACLVGNPANEQSPDKRFCKFCYDLLMEEAELIPNQKKPHWIPLGKSVRGKIPPTLSTNMYQDTPHTHVRDTQGRVNNVNHNNGCTVVLLRTNGRPRREVPVKQIKERFPTGVTLLYRAETIEEAHQVWKQYCNN